MRPPRIILRMHSVTLRGLECSHEYVVGRRTGDSPLRGKDVLRGGKDVLRGGKDVLRGGKDVLRGGKDVLRGGNDVMGAGTT